VLSLAAAGQARETDQPEQAPKLFHNCSPKAMESLPSEIADFAGLTLTPGLVSIIHTP
jgi:hypothetical protein